MTSPINQILLMDIPRTGDLYWGDVVLLMPFEGANNSTGSPGMDDISSSAHGTATVNGSVAKITTANAQFGSSSCSFDLSGNLTFANSSDWDFGDDPFTVECWINPATVAAGTYMIIGKWTASTPQSWIFYQTATDIAFNVSTTGSDNTNVGAGAGLVANTWNAVAVDFDGTSYRFYVGGIMTGKTSVPKTINAGASVLSLGGNATHSGLEYNGLIDEVRITKGVARYASDGGYVPATAAFPSHG